MKLVFHATADLEIQQASEWLDQHGALGAEFAKQLREVLASIASNPYQFGPAPCSHHTDEVRVGRVRRFNYSVYFKVFTEASVAFVIAVQHGHRHPRQWMERLGDFHLTDE